MVTARPGCNGSFGASKPGIAFLLTYTNYVAFSAVANSIGVPLEDGQSGYAPELVALRQQQ